MDEDEKVAGLSLRRARCIRARPARTGRGRFIGKDRLKVFTAILAQTLNVTEAARAAKINHAYVYQLRDRDPGFRKAWELALNEGFAQLEMDMLRRARFGHDRSEEVDGKITKKVHNFDDAQALRMAQAIRYRRAAMSDQDMVAPDEAGMVRDLRRILSDAKPKKA